MCRLKIADLQCPVRRHVHHGRIWAPPLFLSFPGEMTLTVHTAQCFCEEPGVWQQALLHACKSCEVDWHPQCLCQLQLLGLSCTQDQCCSPHSSMHCSSMLVHCSPATVHCKASMYSFCQLHLANACMLLPRLSKCAGLWQRLDPVFPAASAAYWHGPVPAANRSILLF